MSVGDGWRARASDASCPWARRRIEYDSVRALGGTRVRPKGFRSLVLRPSSHACEALLAVRGAPIALAPRLRGTLLRRVPAGRPWFVPRRATCNCREEALHGWRR